MGHPRKGMLEKTYRLGLQLVKLGESLRKQEFSLDWILLESEDDVMIGFLVHGTLAFFLFVLKQNYEVALFSFIMILE